jgi:hypothetical protein
MEDIFGCSFFNDVPVLHHNEAITHLARDGKVVSNKKQCEALLALKLE